MENENNKYDKHTKTEANLELTESEFRELCRMITGLIYAMAFGTLLVGMLIGFLAGHYL